MTPEQRQKDHEARIILTEEIGHSRTQILCGYLNLATSKETTPTEPTTI